HKRRLSASDTRTTHIVGDIAGRRPIIIDDVIAGGSVLKQVDSLYENGAQGGACLAITHSVLLPSALELLDRNSHIEKLVVSNTVPVPPEKRHPKIEVVSIAPLMAEIILRIHEGSSITDKLVLR
ncbi:ribose-phosphate pyrophosphokinase, partial [bacterium]